MAKDQRKIANGRRKGDGTCLLHGSTCKEIDNVRGLFKWGFGLIVTVFIAIGGISATIGVLTISKMNAIEGDIKVIKYQIEKHYSGGQQSKIESATKFPG
jgi:hypothetical protein